MFPNASLTLFFAMSLEEFASVNVPASVFSILINIFFIYCMVFQQREQEQLKPPLNVLQGILVGCNITINVCILSKLCMSFFPQTLIHLLLPYIVLYTMMASVNSSFCQNVFYYCQITPAKSYFICLKKNIRVLIYFALFINGVVYLLGLSLVIGLVVISDSNVSTNDTSAVSDDYGHLIELSIAFVCIFFMTLFLLTLSMFGMSTSSCATIIFLWKHLKNMKKSSDLSSPRFQTQIRMTIRSIAIHALIHFICSVGVFVDLYVFNYAGLGYDENLNILSTIVSCYALGTTITQGIAQSLFRQQVANAWKKCCF